MSTNVERWENLGKLVVGLKRLESEGKQDRFNLWSYFSDLHPEEHEEKLGEIYGWDDPFGGKEAAACVKEGFCGATACAMGHAIFMPELDGVLEGHIRKDEYVGLYLEIDYLGGDEIMRSTEDIEVAGMQAFGLEDDQYEFLFLPDSYSRDDWNTDLNGVIARIECFIEGDGDIEVARRMQPEGRKWS